MFQVQHIAKAYGAQALLKDISFVINAGERIALIGPNGSGKSTLLRIIAGLESADQGGVAFAPGILPGYLPQGLDFAGDLTVGAAAWGAEVEATRADLHRLEAAMANQDLLIAAYGEAAERFDALGGYDLEWQTEAMLGHLGLSGIDLATPVSELSGGQQTRLGLAHILLASPDVLLLDEPTNHLDLDALAWLEDFLRSYRGAALIVSHDRVFLDQTVTRVIELDPQTHAASEYTGTYSDYAAAKSHAHDLHWAAFRDQEAETRRMKHDIAATKEQAKWVEQTTTPRQPGVRRYAKKVAKKALSREKKLDRYLDSDDRIEKPVAGWNLKLDFGEMPRGGQDVIRLQGLGHRYDGDWLFRDATATLRHGERIALLGNNGSGKSTLLRCLMGELDPLEGHVIHGANVRIGYMPQGQDTLDPDDTPLALIRRINPMREADARRLLHFFLFAGDDVFVPIRSLSYGQRSRLLLASIVSGGANCLILDEPLNHLDIPARERFEEALMNFPGAVLVTGHDRAFIDRMATGIWALGDGSLRPYVDRAEMMRVRSLEQ